MKFLLDVNVLVAWGWSDHVDHGRTVSWISAVVRAQQSRLLTSAIPQLGFVRVSVQRTRGQVTVAEAGATLAGMLSALGGMHEFLADDQNALSWQEWCTTAARTTDAHLLALAASHRSELATLDANIPGAFLVPPLVVHQSP